MARVLGISGGGKNGANDAVVKEALLGAQEAGAEVEFIHLLDLNIKPCTGCVACVLSLIKGGSGKCVIKDDDFAWLEDRIYSADGLIISMPVFEKGIPGQFECVTDRMGPSHNKGRRFISMEVRRQKGITDEQLEGPDPRTFTKQLVATYFSVGGSDWVKRAAADFELFGQLPDIKTIDNIVFPWAKSLLVDKKRLARAHEAGKTLALAAADPENAVYVGDRGICPYCHSRLFYFGETPGQATCLVCDMNGTIDLEDGRYVFNYTPAELCRNTKTPEGLRLHADQGRHEEEKLLENRKTQYFKDQYQKYAKLFPASKPPRAAAAAAKADGAKAKDESK